MSAPPSGSPAGAPGPAPSVDAAPDVLWAAARGVTLALARPRLLLAPLAVAAASALAASLGVLALAIPLGVAAFDVLRRLGRPSDGPGPVAAVAQKLAATPALALVALAVLAVLASLVLVLAAYLEGGVLSTLLAADRGDVEAPPFSVAASRFGARLFVILNAGAIAGLAAGLPFLVSIGVLALGLVRGRPGPGLLLTLGSLPILLAGAVAVAIVLQAARREAVARDLAAFDALGAGLALAFRTPGRSLALLALSVAARLLVAGSLSSGPLSFLPGPVVALGDVVGLSAIDLATTGAFLALWRHEPPGVRPESVPAPPALTEAS